MLRTASSEGLSPLLAAGGVRACACVRVRLNFGLRPPGADSMATSVFENICSHLCHWSKFVGVLRCLMCRPGASGFLLVGLKPQICLMCWGPLKVESVDVGWGAAIKCLPCIRYM